MTLYKDNYLRFTLKFLKAISLYHHSGIGGSCSEIIVTDTYYDPVEDEILGVGFCGFLGSTDTEYGDLVSGYDAHAYDFYSIDGDKKSGLVIAVGENTIVSNKYIFEGYTWNEYYLKPGDSFHTTFTKVDVLDDKSFITCGANGMILKMLIP